MSGARPPDNRPPAARPFTHSGMTRRRSGSTVPFVAQSGAGTTWPVDDFNRYLEDLMRAAKIATRKDLGDLAGVSSTQLSNWRRGLAQPRHASLKRIAAVLGVSPIKLYLRAGLTTSAEFDLSGEPDLTVLPAEIRELIELWSDPRMSEEHRKTFLANVRITVGGMRALTGIRPPRRGADRATRAG